eukprot:Hpha_TRINITY_DN36433_c0_g1::TRINITY_DN36433_c0_g1_i1::g.20068::m.20068
MQNGGPGQVRFPWHGGDEQLRVPGARSPSPMLRSSSPSLCSPRELMAAGVRRRLIDELETQARAHPLGAVLGARFARAGFQEPLALAGLLCGPPERRSDTAAFLDIATVVDSPSPLLRSAGITAQATLRRILSRAAAGSSSPARSPPLYPHSPTANTPGLSHQPLPR